MQEYKHDLQDSDNATNYRTDGSNAQGVSDHSFKSESISQNQSADFRRHSVSNDNIGIPNSHAYPPRSQREFTNSQFGQRPLSGVPTASEAHKHYVHTLDSEMMDYNRNRDSLQERDNFSGRWHQQPVQRMPHDNALFDSRPMNTSAMYHSYEGHNFPHEHKPHHSRASSMDSASNLPRTSEYYNWWPPREPNYNASYHPMNPDYRNEQHHYYQERGERFAPRFAPRFSEIHSHQAPPSGYTEQNISLQDRALAREAALEFPSLFGQPRVPPDGPGQDVPPTGNQAQRKVLTNLWEEEGTICLMVEHRGIQVSRRCDNNMVNGTKLSNSAKISRGRRDGVLKGERIRRVVKVGGMSFKGVWIPFERALEIAIRENVLDDLYPLFLADVSRHSYSPQNISRLRQQLLKGARKNPKFLEWWDGIPAPTPYNDDGFLHNYRMVKEEPVMRAVDPYVPPSEGDRYFTGNRSVPEEVMRGRSSFHRRNPSRPRNPGADVMRHHAGPAISGSIPHSNLTHYSQMLRQARHTRRHRRGNSVQLSMESHNPTPLEESQNVDPESLNDQRMTFAHDDNANRDNKHEMNDANTEPFDKKNN